MLNLIEGLVIGIGIGLLARPLLDAYLMWRAIARGALTHTPLPMHDDANA